LPSALLAPPAGGERARQQQTGQVGRAAPGLSGI
jgi:hypothetical protein